MNFEWLVTVVSVMAVGRLERTGKIELRRFMHAIYQLKAEITLAEVVEAAKAVHALDDANKNLIYYYDFLAPIKMILSPPIIEGSPSIPIDSKEHKEGDQPASPDQKSPSDTKSPNIQAEEEKGIHVEESPPPKESPDIENIEPPMSEIPIKDLPDSWCEGEFQIVINRCHDCRAHEQYARHSEEVFFNYFYISYRYS